MKLDRQEMVRRIVRETGYDIRIVQTIMNYIVEQSQEGLLNGDHIELPGVGFVYLLVYESITQRGTALMRRVRVRPSIQMKKRIRAATLPEHLKRNRKTAKDKPGPTGDIGSG